MFTGPCVAPPDLFGYRKSLPAPLQRLDIPFLDEHAWVVDATSVGSPTSPTSSPVSSLMEELLVMIFDDVITSEVSCQCRGIRTGLWLSTPRNLASVSKSWKAVVFACPRLWRHVHVTPLQSIHALKEHLRLSSPLPIQLTVHQWPFLRPTPASGPFSTAELTAQLQSIQSPLEGTCLPPASQRVESIAISATECSTFPNFVLQTWTGPGAKFPALRRIAMNGHVCATWSRSCFFDGRNAPGLARLELSNVVIAHDAFRLPWGVASNVTTLAWAAPVHRRGSLIVSVACFHRVASSFPNLVALELRDHVVGLEFANAQSLEECGIKPLMGVRDLRVSGGVFANAPAAYVLFHLLPSVRRLGVRGRACKGPITLRTVTLALQGLMFPREFGWPAALPDMDHMELECLEEECGEWRTWCVKELEPWREWRETEADVGRVTKVRVQAVIEEE